MFSPAEIMEMAKGIHAAGRRLQRLVERQISRETRWTAPRGATRGADRAAADATCEREAASEAGRAADLVFESAPLPEHDAATVAISPQHLSLIARELADNAFSFSESGTKVKVSVGRGDGMFVLSIEDSGRGMSADEIASVRVPAVRPPTTSSRGWASGSPSPGALPSSTAVPSSSPRTRAVR